MSQMGFFDVQNRLRSLDKVGDPLEKLNQVIPQEEFRGVLRKTLRSKEKKRSVDEQCVPFQRTGSDVEKGRLQKPRVRKREPRQILDACTNQKEPHQVEDTVESGTCVWVYGDGDECEGVSAGCGDGKGGDEDRNEEFGV